MNEIINTVGSSILRILNIGLQIEGVLFLCLLGIALITETIQQQ